MTTIKIVSENFNQEKIQELGKVVTISKRGSIRYNEYFGYLERENKTSESDIVAVIQHGEEIPGPCEFITIRESEKAFIVNREGKTISTIN